MMERMLHRAKNPDRIFDKIYECRFFLSLATSFDGAQEAEKFRYCLNAFLCAFRAIGDRLAGVIEAREGKSAMRGAQRQWRTHPEISLLFDQSNAEVDAVGASVSPRFAMKISFSVADRWKSRSGSRFESRFKSHYGPGVIVRRRTGWQCSGNSKDLMELCDEALKAMEKIVVSKAFPAQTI